MIRKLSLIFALALAVGVTACDDDDKPAADSGGDATEDTDGDNGGGGDDEDATGGGGLECDDGEIEINGECVAEADCDAGEVAKNNVCRPLYDSAADYEFSGTYSYINALQVPDEDDECCFDLTGDGEIDNRLGPILDLVGGFAGDDFDIADTLEGALIDDSFGLILEYRDLDGLTPGDDFGVSVFIASDAEGAGADSWADRDDGNGTFVIDAASFDDHGGKTAGSQMEFNIADINGGTLTAGPSTFLLSLDVGSFSDDLEDLGVFSLGIEAARIEAELEEHDNGIATIDAVGGLEQGMLGGAVPIGELLTIVNELAAECTCSGLDGADLAMAEVIDGEVDVFCNPDATPGNCANAEGLICEHLKTVCDMAPVLTNFLDVDVDGDGADDSISLGLRLGFTGASLADPAIAE